MTFDTLNDLIKQAEEHTNTGNFNEAEKLATTILSELENTSDFSENQAVPERKTLHCSALLSLSDINNRRGDVQEALTLALAALDIAEEYDLPDSKAKASNVVGNVYGKFGSHNKALEYFDKALAQYEKLGAKSGAAKVTGNSGNIYALLGAYDKALEYFDKALTLNEELGEKSSAANVTGNIGIVYQNLGYYDKALEYYNKAVASHNELGEQSTAARVTGNIGLVYHYRGSYDKALEYFFKAIAVLEELGEKSRIAKVTGNIGNVYLDLGSYDKALEYYRKALAIHEKLGEKSGAAIVTGNIGNVHSHLRSYDNALEYYGKALAVHEELGEQSGIARVKGNIANVYQYIGSYDQALEYYHKALAVHELLGEKSDAARVMENIGALFANKKYEGFDAVKAEEFLLKALVVSEVIKAKGLLVSQHKSLADLYEREGRVADAFRHYKNYIEVKEEVQIEEVKKLAEQREREKEIAIAKATADAKHQATEQLLHNVLPPSIAGKMLDGTKLIAEKLPSVSVLFADIVGFTNLSQRITPEELVEGLDRIFSTFDSLAEKYGLEKIKTIGDAYMVVSGAPIQRDDHAEAIAQFALEMVEAMKEFRSFSTGEVIQLRIGIHSGEVVAGVIGKKKFAYDLWGDAVNTASRMESHGEPGKIHVSEEFMHALSLSSFKSFPSFTFQERGEMHIKGKGKMTTYFLEHHR